MSAVVVGVDDSETALFAARRAAAVATALGQPLHIVMAIKTGRGETIQHGNDSFFTDWTQEAKQFLQELKFEIGMPNATSSIGAKDPVKALCAEAEKRGASVLVVGNRRVQGVKRVLGAVATGVLRNAPCDVLVVQTAGAVPGASARHPENHSISSAAMFRRVSESDRSRLDAIATSMQVPAGRALTTEGQIGREFGVLLDGTATVMVGGEVVATLEAGDHFGEMALLHAAGVVSDRRMATVVADSDTWISVMSVQEFQTMLEEFPDAAECIQQVAGKRAAAASV